MGIIDSLKSATALAKTIGSIEVQQKLIDLQGDAMDLLDDNRKLKERVAELESDLNRKESLIFLNNFYWIKTEEGSDEGPFCSTCYDSDNKLIHLHAFNGNSAFGCHACGTVQRQDGSPCDQQVARRFNIQRAMAGQAGKRRG